MNEVKNFKSPIIFALDCTLYSDERHIFCNLAVPFMVESPDNEPITLLLIKVLYPALNREKGGRNICIMIISFSFGIIILQFSKGDNLYNYVCTIKTGIYLPLF